MLDMWDCWCLPLNQDSILLKGRTRPWHLTRPFHFIIKSLLVWSFRDGKFWPSTYLYIYKYRCINKMFALGWNLFSLCQSCLPITMEFEVCFSKYSQWPTKFFCLSRLERCCYFLSLDVWDILYHFIIIIINFNFIDII